MNTLNSKTQTYSNLKAAFIAMMLVLVCHPAIAAGGLDEGITWANEIADWLYKLLGSATLIYVLVQCGLAFFEKKQWADVGIAVAKAAVAGGIPTAVAYAWTIWGS
ncbi:conjugal transfer protein [Vibrio owensii]|uniref:conjugal transfer protein n=1 Tax=Vibrio owensii TaxID=696485 RepID=UPI0018F1CE13|nr:conjugal transfer protein [Vibrio owensii]